MALRGDQRRAKGHLQDQLLPSAFGGVRQRPEHLQPCGEVSDGFEIGRALDGSLAGPLPVGNRLLLKTRPRIVMGHQFRPRVGGLRKSLRQDLRNALVVLLPSALEQ